MRDIVNFWPPPCVLPRVERQIKIANSCLAFRRIRFSTLAPHAARDGTSGCPPLVIFWGTILMVETMIHESNLIVEQEC